MKIPNASTTTLALILRFYYALAISAAIRVTLTKISNRSGIAVQWNGGLKEEKSQILQGEVRCLLVNNCKHHIRRYAYVEIHIIY